jgi:hypothetical protein
MNFWADEVDRDPTAVTMCLMSDASRLWKGSQLVMRRRVWCAYLEGSVIKSCVTRRSASDRQDSEANLPL